MGIDLVVKVHCEYSSEREFQIASQEQGRMMDETASKGKIQSWVMYVNAEAICEEGQCS